MNSKKELLYNPIFVLSLVVLALNDHVFKDLYHNWLTGKVSDFSGLVVLPIFITFLLPKAAKWSCHISALFFVFWKTELSSDFIELLNLNSLFTIGRVVDYSDFIALLILPIPWMIIHKHYKTSKVQSVYNFRLSAIVLITFVVLTATSIHKPSNIEPQGTIFLGKKYRLKVPKDTVLARIQRLGYSWKYENDRYCIENIILPEISIGSLYKIEQDTIKELTFSFLDFPYQPTKKQERLGAQYLYIQGAKFSDINTITDWRVMKHYSKMYGEISGELFAEESTRK